MEPNVFVYLDDIIVVTETFEEHKRILKEVAKRLKDAGLTISVEKSRFCLPEMKFLGFVIDHRGLRVDPEKISCIMDYPTPKTVKDIRRFIGMAGYYRRFVPNFSQLSAPLTDLIKSKGKIGWTEKADKAFNELKSRLIETPILTAPNWEKLFTIHVDASDFALGAVITQGEKEEEKPIAYMSKKLVGAQRRYTTTEKECLAILTAIEHFRGYIEGTRFRVVTDHAALTWLNSIQVKTGRLARWIARLSCFDFDIVHKKGKLHVIPDALSRNENADEPNTIFTVNIVPEDDPDYVVLRRDIQLKPKDYPNYQVMGGKIYKYCPSNKDLVDKDFEWKLYVPQSDIPRVLCECHCSPLSPHFGYMKTLAKVKLEYYWPTINKDVKDYVSKCNICAAVKYPNFKNRPPMKPHSIPRRKFEVICVDFATVPVRSKAGNTSFFCSSGSFN